MKTLNLIPYPNQILQTEEFVCHNLPVTECLDNSLPAESYTLSVTPQEIRITGTDAGIFYAKQTLKQLQIQFGNNLPCLEIKDAPRFAYRGFMLDSSRHFLPKEDVMKIIDVLAFFKINKLHWHLVDDQGFRVEIKAYPKLTEAGAFRGPSKFGLVDANTGNNGFFTQKDICEIISYAKEHMIDIIPEIEIPGHETAMLAAYPEAGCFPETIPVETRGGIFDKLICAGKESSFTFITQILDELCELFPYDMIHIGGDEACKRIWRECPDCQQKIKELGLKDENALQQWFVIKIQEYLKTKGKTAIVWNDSLRGEKLPTDCVVQMWMGDINLITEFASRGGKIIQSSTECHYLDYPYAIWDVPKILNTPVCPDFLPEESIIGVECPLWTERVTTIDRAFHLILPRIPAMAETAWTTENLRNNNDFLTRYKDIHAYLNNNGITGAPQEYWSISEELAKEEMELHNRTWYTPENIEEFNRQNEMMAAERAIYGDER